MKSAFGPFVSSLGVSLTEAQRVLYGVLFDGEDVPDTDIGRELFGFVGPVPELARRTLVVVKGGRIGGTRFGAIGGLHRSLTLSLSKLARGEPAYCALVGPDMRIARQALSFVRIALETNSALKRLIKTDSSDSIIIKRPDGHEIHFVCLPATAGGSALRGRWYTFVHFVEGAYFRDSNFVVNLEDLYKSVAPRTLGNILIESTPWAESGLVYQFFATNFGAPSIALVARAPTRLMRTDDPDLLASVDAEYKRDEMTARQEYGAEFLTAGAGLFFDPSAIDACVADELENPAPATGDAHAGADFGFEHDHSAIVVASKGRGDLITVCSFGELQPSRGAPLKPSEVVREFALVMQAYGVRAVVSDSHYRQAIIEHLNAHSLEFSDAPGGREGKTRVHLRFRELVNEKRLRLPNNPRLISQLKAIVSRPQPGGGLAISFPRRGAGSGHGDLASAAILAVWSASGGDDGGQPDYVGFMERMRELGHCE